MRIVYLHQHFNTPAMAGGTRSYEIGRRLVRAGHDVQMITAWREPTERRGWFSTVEEGIHVHWLPIRYANSMSFWRRIAAFVSFAWHATRKASSLDADVIFATSTPLTIAAPAMIASRKQGVPFVFEVRDMWPDVPIAFGIIRNPLMISATRWFERLTYSRANSIIALAPGMRKDIIAKNVPAEKVAVVPNGCDLDLAETGTDVRTRHAWLGNRKLVIYAGAIGMANSVTYLVHLAARVSEVDPEIRFVVFGEGSEREAVSNLAAEKSVLHKTLFLFGPAAKKDLAPWLKAADLHVALMKGPKVYLKDAVNNKFFDALAFGKPVANNFDGWQTEIAEEADIGVALDPVDHDTAARQLVAALQDDAWLAGASRRARELAKTRFNRDLLARQVEAILVRAARQSGPSG